MYNGSEPLELLYLRNGNDLNIARLEKIRNAAGREYTILHANGREYIAVSDQRAQFKCAPGMVLFTYSSVTINPANLGDNKSRIIPSGTFMANTSDGSFAMTNNPDTATVFNELLNKLYKINGQSIYHYSRVITTFEPAINNGITGQIDITKVLMQRIKYFALREYNR